MAKSYTHLTPKERYDITTRLKAGGSRSEIARSMGRSPSTVSRELRRLNVGLYICTCFNFCDQFSNLWMHSFSSARLRARV